MIDATKTELNAILNAGQIGGEFLDSVKITDLSRLTQQQYQTYVRCIISAYLGEMDRLRLIPIKENELPF